LAKSAKILKLELWQNLIWCSCPKFFR